MTQHANIYSYTIQPFIQDTVLLRGTLPTWCKRCNFHIHHMHFYSFVKLVGFDIFSICRLKVTCVTITIINNRGHYHETFKNLGFFIAHSTCANIRYDAVYTAFLHTIYQYTFHRFYHYFLYDLPYITRTRRYF